jgi:hypothetical protein
MQSSRRTRSARRLDCITALNFVDPSGQLSNLAQLLALLVESISLTHVPGTLTADSGTDPNIVIKAR